MPLGGPAVAESSPTPDRITLTGLRAQGHHGVYAFERERGQMFSCDAVLELDTSAAAAGDDLRRTVNYAEIAHQLYSVLAAEAGAWGVRVHDAAASVDAVRTVAAVRAARGARRDQHQS